jgi:methionyl-tRNA formyltransferase
MAKIVALTNGSPHSWIVLNALVAEFGPLTVLAEDAEPKSVLIQRRMKRQGVIAVLGQIGFVLLQKIMAKRSAPRVLEIIRQSGSDPDPNRSCTIMHIGSVNSMACRAALAMLKPDVVVVFGTRIIKRETLEQISAPLINFHSGLNPKYRGQAGGYWALAMGDPDHAGVTAHLVDAGVDTGDVLYQAKFEATPRDSFVTYFYLQAAAIRPLAVKAVKDALAGALKPFKPALPSQQFYHPTLWFYLWTAWRKGVR